MTFLFTGNNINFGNYSCLTKKDVKVLSDKSSLWSSFSGSFKKHIKNYNEIWTLNTMLKGKNIDLENENKVIQNENSELRKKIELMERVLYKLDDKLSKVKMVVNDMDLVNMNELTD